MKDRELLELAAKAAGVPVTHWWAGMDTFIYKDDTGSSVWWNPLKSDGDALRLAVKLCMQVECSKGYQHVSVYGRSFTVSERHDGFDPDAATRRAIVRAAAAIGGPHA